MMLESELIVLGVSLAAWCVLHSAMISEGFLRRVRARMGRGFRFYRLIFNAVAVVTFLPLVSYSLALRSDPVFAWQGRWRLLQVLLLVVAVVLFLAGGRRYDGLRFLGLRQIREEASGALLTESGRLDTGGVLGVIRHPWYTGALALIWARPLDRAALLANIVLSAYLVAGTMLEEAKLVREFGEEYRAYQKRVSMLVPWRWLKSRLATGRGEPPKGF